jgi:predicted RNA-binding protein associated with RNAse of E/G family
MPHRLHPIKVERFDVTAGTNTDPKGVVRRVETFRIFPWGLYMGRSADHPHFDYLESWLLPSLHLRASIFHFRPGHERDQDRYVDVGVFWRDGDVWHSRDHYLDLVVSTGRGTRVEDIDELFAAVAAGVLDTDDAERAVATALTAVDGIASHGHDLDAWLTSEGCPVEWR